MTEVPKDLLAQEGDIKGPLNSGCGGPTLLPLVITILTHSAIFTNSLLFFIVKCQTSLKRIARRRKAVSEAILGLDKHRIVTLNPNN